MADKPFKKILDHTLPEVNLVNKTPEKKGVEVDNFNKTSLEKSTNFPEINLSSQTPNKEGVSIPTYEKNIIENAEDFTPLSDNDIINKPFSKMNLTSLNMSPTIENENNKYGDVINGLPDGNYPNSQSNLIKNSTNPIVPNPVISIGLLNENKIQTVNDFEPFPILKESMIRRMDSKLDDLTDMQIFPFTNENLDNLYDTYTYDPRENFTVNIPLLGNSGQPRVSFLTRKSYKGSILDTILPVNNSIFDENFNGYETNGGNLELGTGDFTFESIYNNDQTSKIDDRLNIRYTNSGYRGEEPYVVYDVGTDMSSDSRMNPYDAIKVDNSRLVSFLESDKGKSFTAKQFTYQFLFSPRNEKYWNPLSVFAGGQFNLFNLGIERHFGQPFLQGYTNTVYEKIGGNVLGIDVGFGTPGAVADGILKGLNSVTRFTGGWVGGNAFQVLGSNKRGDTDTTNVSPGGSPVDIIKGAAKDLLSNFAKSALANLIPIHTPNGGFPEYTNPRKLEYKQQRGFFLGVQWFNFFDLRQPGLKIKGSPSLKPWRDFDLKSGDTVSKDMKRLELKPYQNIPEEIDLTSFLPGSDIGNYESKSPKKINNSIDSDSVTIYEQKSLPGDIVNKKYGTLGIGGGRGDVFTNLPINPGKDLSDAYGTSGRDFLESTENGYPMYFKDLRDNSYIFLRAYLEGGITETVTPNWTQNTFIGRSEDAYQYQNTTRDLQFSLKIFANTKSELHMIYDKMEKLTSLCYPQYKFDNVNFTHKLRAKPPLTKFRLGELYGSSDNEMMGFIQSITYSVPESTTWEHEKGSRVPKHIIAQFSYKVLHKEVPNMLTKFYGKGSKSNIHFLDKNDRNSLIGEQ